ncbi:hypothetical protein [Streptomyces griseoloalbus]|uniref:Uncharacterized protein n=1 Tax=Streptomyces griseoloalbus TaxID=67303 RepID=A0A7W8FBF6_9ACTN|nr:hypothetical protein [Streptomyces albaduncus]MBB5130248.1 hypothetical protein [Streptomyces albaduncus]GGW50038.1 hypothetical protein GCM10010340_30350 [Streptomyces albaduncus]
MLRVVYRTVGNPASGRLVNIDEYRGRLDVQLREGVNIEEILHALNDELEQFLAKCGWFQIWRGRVISANSPESPLTVQYVTDPDVDLLTCVQVRECGGVVRVHVCPDASLKQFARVINLSTERLLAGGQWFQYFEGEIVTMDSAERDAA